MPRLFGTDGIRGPVGSLIDASRGKQPLKLIGRLSRERPNTALAAFGTYCRAEGTILRAGMEATIQ